MSCLTSRSARNSKGSTIMLRGTKMAVRGLGAEHGVHVRLAPQLHRLTSAAICCVGQSTNDAAKPYQKWSFTIDRAPVKVSRLQVRGRRTLSPASRLAGGPQQSSF